MRSVQNPLSGAFVGAPFADVFTRFAAAFAPIALTRVGDPRTLIRETIADVCRAITGSLARSPTAVVAGGVDAGEVSEAVGDVVLPVAVIARTVGAHINTEAAAPTGEPGPFVGRAVAVVETAFAVGRIVGPVALITTDRALEQSLPTAHAVLERAVVTTAVGVDRRARAVAGAVDPVAVVRAAVGQLLDAVPLRFAGDEIPGVAATVAPDEAGDAGVIERFERKARLLAIRQRQLTRVVGFRGGVRDHRGAADDSDDEARRRSMNPHQSPKSGVAVNGQ